jgi:hypothetical protein
MPLQFLCLLVAMVDDGPDLAEVAAGVAAEFDGRTAGSQVLCGAVGLLDAGGDLAESVEFDFVVEGVLGNGHWNQRQSVYEGVGEDHVCDIVKSKGILYGIVDHGQSCLL